MQRGIIKYMKQTRVSAIAAISAGQRALGYQNKLLWHLPEDLKRFKELTSGHPIIMGRKTYESIVAYLGTPLPNRTNIVLSTGDSINHPDVTTARSIEEALEQAAATRTDEIFIGGGSTIYELALPYTDRLYLTLVEDEPQADSFFPEYSKKFPHLLQSETIDGQPPYTFITLEK